MGQEASLAKLRQEEWKDANGPYELDWSGAGVPARVMQFDKAARRSGAGLYEKKLREQVHQYVPRSPAPRTIVSKVIRDGVMRLRSPTQLQWSPLWSLFFPTLDQVLEPEAVKFMLYSEVPALDGLPPIPDTPKVSLLLAQTVSTILKSPWNATQKAAALAKFENFVLQLLSANQIPVDPRLAEYKCLDDLILTPLDVAQQIVFYLWRGVYPDLQFNWVGLRHSQHMNTQDRTDGGANARRQVLQLWLDVLLKFGEQKTIEEVTAAFYKLVGYDTDRYFHVLDVACACIRDLKQRWEANESREQRAALYDQSKCSDRKISTFQHLADQYVALLRRGAKPNAYFLDMPAQQRKQVEDQWSRNRFTLVPLDITNTAFERLMTPVSVDHPAVSVLDLMTMGCYALHIMEKQLGTTTRQQNQVNAFGRTQRHMSMAEFNKQRAAPIHMTPAEHNARVAAQLASAFYNPRHMTPADRNARLAAERGSAPDDTD